MAIWLILLIAAVVFLLFEMFTPTLFFINLAVAAAVSAIFSYIGYSLTVVTFVFLIVSIAAIGLVRPFLLRKLNGKEHQTGVKDKYIGKIAKVVKNVTKTDGRISIYGEEWQAHLMHDVPEDTVIPAGEEVKIVSNDSIIFTVEKIKEN